MTITAKVIADSVSPHGKRLTTMQLRYPRFVHAEAKTHRMLRISDAAYEFLGEVGFMDDRNLSRNASSSRAIPVERLIQDVLDDPAMPVWWGKNQPGMQAREELAGQAREEARMLWLRASYDAIGRAQEMVRMGVHKQIVNRIIEPWGHIRTVVTATEWTNFYALRRHPDAQPEMRALADAMWEAQQASTPQLLQPGEWHLPYIEEIHNLDWNDSVTTRNAIQCSVARCARVSYLTHEGKSPNIRDDLALYNRLVGSIPLHASPAEHVCTPDRMINGKWEHSDLHANLVGWISHRKMLPNENINAPQ